MDVIDEGNNSLERSRRSKKPALQSAKPRVSSQMKMQKMIIGSDDANSLGGGISLIDPLPSRLSCDNGQSELAQQGKQAKYVNL